MKTFKNNSIKYERRIGLECIKRIIFSVILLLSFLKLHEVSSKSQSDLAVETTTKYVESNEIANEYTTENYTPIFKHFTFDFNDITQHMYIRLMTIELHLIPHVGMQIAVHEEESEYTKTDIPNEVNEVSTLSIDNDEMYTFEYAEDRSDSTEKIEGLLDFNHEKNNKENHNSNTEEVTFEIEEEITENLIEDISYIDKYVYNDVRKSYMSWESISVPTSRQWTIQYTYAYTDEYTGMRLVDNRYLIAMGSYYTHNIGQYVDVYLENGIIIPCIIGDAKSDLHTNAEHTHGLDGSVVEFMVDPDALPEFTRITGDISNLYDSWNSKVVMVRLFNKNLFE